MQSYVCLSLMTDQFKKIYCKDYNYDSELCETAIPNVKQVSAGEACDRIRGFATSQLQEFERNIWSPMFFAQNTSTAASYLFNNLPYAKGGWAMPLSHSYS
mmetsp:Transcript_37420/g.117948  ORF Transcript_37420/g.117948 Transcript_37420/m.117948 type:complete len:101 (+) Transcript_37420:1165-1467(+)